MNARKVVGWTIVAILGVFVVANLASTRVRLVVATVEMPTAFLVIASAALGAGAVFAFQYVRGEKQKGGAP